ncbi:MAG: ATP-binding protein [Candidatus Riflebacteria bacterium]|nr:ATP-binding protein [Candidatus Riflebacteria bacterium]
MPRFERRLRIDLPPRQSAFLWGPRKTGKSTYLGMSFPESLRFDLLDTDLFLELARQPSRLRQRLLATPPAALARPIILDEVQKVPMLLDEVHWLVENRGLAFILCGSSARKLRRGKANLLGGRAWRYELFPLTWSELEQFDLLDALNRGLLPDHYLSVDPDRSLRSYVRDYLKEEVFDEGLTRNIPAFSRFLDAVGYSHGQLTNYANIARDCGVDAKTVKEYYQILVDTLLGTFVEPYKLRQERKVIGKAAKFYLFDVGVAGSLTKRHLKEARGDEFGKALEHFILMELLSYRSYSGLDYDISFWRTKSGTEVDFVLGRGQVAVEVKGSSRVDSRDLFALRSFCDTSRPRDAFLVCAETAPRVDRGIQIMPWQTFLERLWGGEVLS